MPTNRRPRQRPGRRLPNTIERLVAGEPIEESEEVRVLLIEVGYFGDYDVPQAIRQRALDALARWRPQ
jgi:hypothetical protein